MQKRLVRKLDLENAISEIPLHPAPKAHLEQYTITPQVAAEMLYIATYVNDDIIDKTVVDLGCGTGRLVIGAALLGAKQTIGVDLDKVAIGLAQKNAENMGVEEKMFWITADLDAIHGTFDTIMQNPPFGVRTRRADRRFIEKSLELGDRIYSIHKGSKHNRGLIKRLRSGGTRCIPTQPSPFLERFIGKHGGRIRGVYAMMMEIPYMFDFHSKKKHRFVVDLYVIDGRHTSKS
ncbi:MAG: 50S ribosomal protein L11 methyltransferase [Candidatus Bathyarchaeota archaeon]|nr:MAG: 50S ribosomal protein L11 methyltransferase [Candidatus Bathyarchaeota archaeon]